jgi:hypothetical protein
MDPKGMRVGEPGDELEDPRGMRLVLIETAESSGGRRLVVDWHVPAGARIVAADHYHPDGPEVWEIREGGAGYRLRGREEFGEAPFTYTVPASTSHGHPWNTGEGTMVARQIIASEDPIPEITGGVQGFFETLFAFSQQGRLSEEGEIEGRVQNLLSIHDLLMPGSFLAGPPRWLQLGALGIVSAAARAGGKRAYLRPEFANRASGW